MRDYLAGAIFAILLLGIMAATNRTQADVERFVILHPESDRTMLLDTETGRSWFYLVVMQEDGAYPLPWAPISFNEVKPGVAIFDPDRGD